MIDLYTWTTPNGRKISIMLEETGLQYRVIPVNLGKEEQMAPAFTALNPNQKIPTIVDHDVAGGPLAIFESGAILIHRDKEYLAADYSIADIATYPWVSAAWGPLHSTLPDELGKLGNLSGWLDRMKARPAVQRGMAVPKV